MLAEEIFPAPAAGNGQPAADPGFQGPGRGRARGSGLVVRASLRDILPITWCRQVAAVLALRVAADGASEALLNECLASVKVTRARLNHISDRVLSSKASASWRSG